MIDFGQDEGCCGFLLGQELRCLRQHVGPRRALGAADVQENHVDLVFHLDGVNHPAIVLTRLIDEDDGEGADRNQHEKSGCKQQGLADGAAGFQLGLIGCHVR